MGAHRHPRIGQHRFQLGRERAFRVGQQLRRHAPDWHQVEVARVVGAEREQSVDETVDRMKRVRMVGAPATERPRIIGRVRLQEPRVRGGAIVALRESHEHQRRLPPIETIVQPVPVAQGAAGEEGVAGARSQRLQSRLEWLRDPARALDRLHRAARELPCGGHIVHAPGEVEPMQDVAARRVPKHPIVSVAVGATHVRGDHAEADPGGRVEANARRAHPRGQALDQSGELPGQRRARWRHGLALVQHQQHVHRDSPHGVSAVADFGPGAGRALSGVRRASEEQRYEERAPAIAKGRGRRHRDPMVAGRPADFHRSPAIHRTVTYSVTPRCHAG